MPAPAFLPPPALAPRPAAAPPRRPRRRAPPTAARRTFVVELPRPLGLVLEEAGAAGGARRRRVVVAGVGAGGASDGIVRVGDVVVATSATFGAETWPARSLDGCVAAIRSRCGGTVKLVLEREEEGAVVVAPPPERRVQARSRPLGPGEAGGAAGAPSAAGVGAGGGGEDGAGAVGGGSAGGAGEGAEGGAVGVERNAQVEALLAEFATFRTRRVAEVLVEAATHAVRAWATAPVPRVGAIAGLVHRLRRAEAPLTLRFYNNLMWSYVRAGAPARAVDVFDDLPNPNVECYTTLVKALGALRRPREAVRLLGEMRARAVAPGLWTYNAVIAACVRGGRLDWAREVLAEMAAAGVRPNVVSWNTIIDWHARQKKGAGRLAGAAAAFAEMKAAGVQPNTVTYTTMMKSYAASGAMNKAEGIFAEMKKRFPDICVDVEAYNTLLAAHAARLDWRRCLELLDEMQLSMTRRALSASPAPDEGGGGGGERLEEYRPGDDGFGHGGVSRSASSSRNVLSSDDGLGARSGTGRGGPAGNMDIEQLLRVKPNAHSYALVIKGCADARRVEIAHTVFDEMLADGISPPPPHAVVSLLGGYASTGDFPRALSMLKRLKEWGIAPNLRMMCALMNSCLNAGEPDLALAIFAKVKASSTPPDVVAFTMLLKAYGMKGDLAKALNVVKAMTRDGATVRPNVVTYNALISCANENGRPDAALRALRMALDDRSVDIDDNTFHALVQRASVDSRRFTARGGGRMSAAAEAASVDVGDDLSDEEDALGAVSEGAESLRQTAADEADAENIMGQSAREYLDYLLAVVQIVREAGRAPNGTVYVALLEACEMCDDGDLGVKLVEDRQRGGFRVGRAFASEARLYEESMRSRAKRS